MQLTNISVSISMTDEHTKERIMGIIRVDHVVENNGLKNKIWKHLERQVHVRFNIIQVLL
jgi:hypothetical protein